MDKTMILYMVLFTVSMLLAFFAIKLKEWIKLGYLLVFRKHFCAVIFEHTRRFCFYAVKPDNLKFEINESTYYVDPAKTYYAKILLKLWLKKKEYMLDTKDKKDSKREYYIREKKVAYFGNAPCSLYIEDNPEPLDMCDFFKTKEIPSITGRQLSTTIKLAQLSGASELVALLKKYAMWIIIGGLFALFALGFFIVKGLTPAIAATAKEQGKVALGMIPILFKLYRQKAK